MLLRIHAPLVFFERRSLDGVLEVLRDLVSEAVSEFLAGYRRLAIVANDDCITRAQRRHCRTCLLRRYESRAAPTPGFPSPGSCEAIARLA